MAGDSAFRRLLLDTVAAAVARPPSSASLIELLRIATPGLLTATNDGGQRQLQAETKVRIKSQRDKLFRTLQLRIHPDKHPGDERATELFQAATNYYGKCVEAMEEEDRRRRRSGSANGVTKKGAGDATATDHHNNSSNWAKEKASKGNGSGNGNANGNGNGKGEQRGDSNTGTDQTQFPQWNPWWYRHENPHIPRRPTAGPSTHSHYENFGRENPNPRRQGRNAAIRDARPSSHRCPVAASVLLCPPVGLYALHQSLQVEQAWNEGRLVDARDHSERALDAALFGYACFGFLVLFLWLGGDGPDSGWEGLRHRFQWDDGP